MIRPDSPQDLREVLDAPFHFLRRNLRPVATVAIAGGLVQAVPKLVSQVVLGQAMAEGPQASAVTTLAVSYGSSFVVLLVYLVLNLAIYVTVHDLLEGQPTSLGRAYREALRARRFFTVALKYLALGAGLCACGVPTLYLGIVLGFVVPIMLVEGQHGLGALGRSLKLSHHKARDVALGGTFLRLVIVWHVLYLVLSSISGVTTVPTVVAQWFTTWRDVLSGQIPDPATLAMPLWLAVPLSILGAVTYGLSACHPAALFSLYYRDVRDLAEGHDLHRALDARLGEHT